MRSLEGSFNLSAGAPSLFAMGSEADEVGVFGFSSEVTRWEAREDSWYFAHVPAEQGEEIAAIPIPPRGFGSLRVRAQIGDTTWTTSIFPDDGGRYALPLKRAVRSKEHIEEGDTVAVEIELLDL